MLFKVVHLDGIRSGRISVAFRKWKKMAVNESSQVKTAVGIVQVIGIEKFSMKGITAALAAKAGYDNLESLLLDLSKIKEGTLYKISLRYGGADPRIALRNKTDVTSETIDTILQKLDRLDSFSKNGPWTHQVLTAIQNNPQLRAVDLARLTDREKDWLKINIRKLKNLGLTISHEVGYSISPLGKRVLQNLTRK